MPTKFANLVRRRVGALRTAFRKGGLGGLARKLRRAARHRADAFRRHLACGSEVSVDPGVGAIVDPIVVTVVVATRDRDHLLPATLRSVQLQAGVSWECIVVDDGSTDRSLEVAQRFAAADSRFRVFTQPRSGVSAARNAAIARAGGPITCFIDDDDLLLAGSLAERAELMASAALDVAGAYCDWVNIDFDERLEKAPQTPAKRPRANVTIASMRHGTPFISSSPMTRTDVLRRVGGFRPELERGEDADLWFRICALGYRFVMADVTGVAYRRTPQSLVLGDPAAQLVSLTTVGSGRGLLPVQADASKSLAEIALLADRAVECYRYLALIAVKDVEEAVRVGSERLPACVILEHDRDTLVATLTQSAVTRLSLGDCASAKESSHRSIAAMCDRLIDQAETVAADVIRASETDGRALDTTVEMLREMTPRLVVVPADCAVDGSIVLVAEALYHVDELGPLSEELRSRGRAVEFMLAPTTVESARFALERYAERILEYDLSIASRASAVVVLNDWGAVRGLIERANAHSVPTFAKVEGVQDFDDVDTGRVRSPYLTASHILAQGPNDVAALPHKDATVVGSSRLERLWTTSFRARSGTVLVNLNFTFGVLVDEREFWIDSVSDAVRRVGARAVISAHPGERARPAGFDVSMKPFRHDIRDAGVLVSRFSTVPFEALALAVPFVYHNPHAERVPTFTQPDGAFRITRNASELAAAISEALARNGQPRTAAETRFFATQVDIDPDRSSEQRTADCILAVIERTD